MDIKIYLDGKVLDLYEEDSIFYTNKLVDIEKLSNIFADYTNSWTLPASGINNDIFKHYYDIDIDNTFNANIKVDAYIEVNTLPFRYGKLQLEGIKTLNDEPDSYKVSFYGGAIQLTDLFKDDTLDRLDYKKNALGVEELIYSNLTDFDYTYNSANFVDSLGNPTFKNGDLITPLISYTNRDWNFGTNDALDITTTDGAIDVSELRQGLRVIRIIEAIEEKYDITLSRDFFGKSVFLNAFLWLNQRTSPTVSKFNYPIVNAFVGVDDDNNIFLNSDNNVVVQRNKNYNYSSTLVATREYSTCQYNIVPSIPTVIYNAYILDEKDNIIASKEGVTGTNVIYATQNISEFGTASILKDDVYKLIVQPSTSMNFSTTVTAKRMSRELFAGSTVTLVSNVSSSNPLTATIVIKTSDNIPKMKVSEFIAGLMKAFKLVIRPLSNKSFYVDTLDNYYKNGDIIDITKYVDYEEVSIDRPEIYKSLIFKYQKTDNVAGKKFRQLNDSLNDEVGYGDIKAEYASIDSKNDLKIELPFENMLYERMRVQAPGTYEGETTNIIIGQSISSSDNISFSPNNSKPIIFFNNGIASNTRYPFKVRYAGEVASISYNYIIGGSNDELFNQVTDSLNFSDDLDPWHLQPMTKNLFTNYWGNWIDTIYSLKQRKIGLSANLPADIIDKLSLNDKLIIKGNRFKISDYNVKLNDGETNFTLFNDLNKWDGYNSNSMPLFTSLAFTPDPYYIIDTLTIGSQVYIYGTFTTYGGVTAMKLIKLNANGTVDTSFNTGSGFNSNNFGFQSITNQRDGKLLVTGDFSIYNGTTKNRIVRLNLDGSIDTSFNIGTGFNGLTSAIGIDSNDSIIVGGSYSTYNGNSSNRLIKLLPNGLVDTSFNVGSGFNNAVNEVAIDSNDNVYVTGYFSTYNGTTANRIIKLLPNGSVDTSFVYGTGFNNIASTPNGVIMFDDDSILCYGHFTTYNGVTANRIVRINSNGSINTSFNAGTGFNGLVYDVQPILNGKILVIGGFTSYNGVLSNGTIVLNSDGSIYKTITAPYINVYTINGYLYGQLLGQPQVIFADLNYPPISTNSIVCNAGTKYYDIDVLKQGNWSVYKEDKGFGTDWVELDIKTNSVTIKIDEKASQLPPDVYNSRTMDLVFTIDGEVSVTRVLQRGLEQ